MELVYIGEDLPMTAPPFVQPFQDKENDRQFSWPQFLELIQSQAVSVRPATESELELVNQHAAFIRASGAYLLRLLGQA